MNQLDVIKNRIKKFYLTQPIVQIEILITRPKAGVIRQNAKIIGVYPNLFQLESEGRTYSFSYTDVLTNTIKIESLQ